MVIYMIKNLTEAESAIMKKIWELNSPVTSSVLMGYFSEERGWKSQTVSTFLSRLGKKGFLSVKRCGAANEYTAVISESAYEQAGAREVIDRLYNGSVKNMIASLVDCGAISDEEMDELRNWFSKR